jgi:fatty-acyl-CoA synthase
MLTGLDAVIADPTSFASDPRLWMKWCSDYEASITCGPHSSCRIAGRLLERESSLDLSSLRLAINGSEMVVVDEFEQFLVAGSQRGLEPSAAYPVYGMAKATLAVTMPSPGVGLAVDSVDRSELAKGAASRCDQDDPSGRDLAILGFPIDDVAVRIGSQPQESVERVVGEIYIRGQSVTPGYLGVDNSHSGT